MDFEKTATRIAEAIAAELKAAYEMGRNSAIALRANTIASKVKGGASGRPRVHYRPDDFTCAHFIDRWRDGLSILQVAAETKSGVSGNGLDGAFDLFGERWGGPHPTPPKRGERKRWLSDAVHNFRAACDKQGTIRPAAPGWETTVKPVEPFQGSSE